MHSLCSAEWYGNRLPEFECRNKNSEGRDRVQFEGTNLEFTWENPEKSPRLSIRKSGGPDDTETRQNLNALTCTKLSTFEQHKVLTAKVTQCTDVTSRSRVFICDNKRPLIAECGNLRKQTAWLNTFLFSDTSAPALRSTEPLIQCVLGSCSGGKAAGAWSQPSSPPKAEVTNEWRYTSTAPYAFKAWEGTNLAGRNVLLRRPIQWTAWDDLWTRYHQKCEPRCLRLRRFVSWDCTAGLMVTSVELWISHTTNDALTQPARNFPSLFFSHTFAYTVLNAIGHFLVTQNCVSGLE